MGVKRQNKQRFALIAGLVLVVGLGLAWYLAHHVIAVLAPAGTIGRQERQLILVAVLLSIIVVVPVYVMTIMIAWKYRASNTKAKYQPDFDHSLAIESIWWGIPLVIITILSVITWQSAHQLDPFRPLSSSSPPVTIDVVSLDWKWLFIYPDQNVASVNYVEMPLNRPVSFNITSDTVMNSFWIPRLGGQIYAMPGMMTQLHLMADKTGSFAGSSANISGLGFAGMNFIAKAVSQSDYNSWLFQVKKSHAKLDLAAYNRLAQPSQNVPVSYFSPVSSGLFESTVMKYMQPTVGESNL